jgi:inorganic pyrophosphatase
MHPWHDIYVDDHLIEHEFPVVIEDVIGPADAIRILQEALSLYRQLRRGELSRA